MKNTEGYEPENTDNVDGVAEIPEATQAEEVVPDADLSTKIEERIEADQSKESTEKHKPKVKIDIFYGPHYSEADAEKIKPYLDGVDIFIPELSGWTPSIRYAFADVAFGRKDPDTVLREQEINEFNSPFFGFMHGLLKAIHNSRVKIGLVDIPADHPIEDKLAKSHTTEDVTSQKGSVRLGQLVQHLRFKYKEQADSQNEREDAMVIELEKEVERIISADEKLSEKDKVKVLMFLGSNHTRVHHLLKNAGQDSEMHFAGGMPVTFDHVNEVSRRYKHGKSVNFELASRAVLEEHFYKIIFMRLNMITQDTNKIIKYFRALSSKFSTEEIREIVETEDPQKMMMSLIAKKKILPPFTEEDMDDFISSDLK